MVRDLSLVLSVLLLLFGAFLHVRNDQSLQRRIACLTLFLVSVFLYILYAISDSFTGHGIDESVIYHIKRGLAGAGFSNYSKLIICSVAFLLLSLFFSFFVFLRKGKGRSSAISDKTVFFPFLLILLSLAANPATQDLCRLTISETNLINFDFYYRKPSIKKTGALPRNLVMIYAESLERTYFDKATFPGLIKGLRELQSKSTYFTDIQQAFYTGWTIGGLVATQCGIPLTPPPNSYNSMSGMDRFLPSAVGLSDLLHDEGYKLVYYGGADLDFAGKGKFLRDHHYDEIYGKKELSGLLTDRSYQTAWGLFDDTLLDLAFNKFVSLSEQGEKFALILLTLDTHSPDGGPSQSCRGISYADGTNPMLNAVACSDHLISSFIRKVLQSPFAKDTVVVVLSDHLAMKNSAYDLLKKTYRANMFMVIDPKDPVSREVRRRGTSLDVGPTILPFIGYEGSLGLGRNILDRKVPDSEIKYIAGHIQAWKRDLSKFWDFPRIRGSVKIDVAGERVDIDGREFKLPILIEFYDDLKTVLLFNFYDQWQGRLIKRLDNLKNGQNFILVDKCQDLAEAGKGMDQDGYCMIIGRGDKHLKKMDLHGNIALTMQDLTDILHQKNTFRTLRIAHAGGWVDRTIFTNSLQALDHNLKRGFKYFELDLSYTKDRQLVCIHDFELTWKRLTRLQPQERPTLEMFQSQMRDHCKVTPCTIETLAAWMKKNPSAIIITDVKDDGYMEALKTISMKLPNFADRVIPQVFFPEDYAKAKQLGYKQVIWTLYRYNGTNEDVLKWVDTFLGPFAITMPKERALAGLSAQLAQKGIPSYVYTINDWKEAFDLMRRYKVTNIYTDLLPAN